MNEDRFFNALKDQGIELTTEQMNQFNMYYETLVEWNEKMNLTAITDRKDVYLKHFYDSITASFYVDFNKELSICDVGAGAGFPSIPLKICFPHLKVTIVDSLKKRMTFLNELANRLGLTDVAFYHDRAELFGKNKQFRHSFDLVMARAVAKMSVLSELCLPLVKTGGLFVAMKGPNAELELKEAENAIELLGAEVDQLVTFDLPDKQGERNIVTINKLRQTPKAYPRKPGTPNKNPLT
ncbi:16S rRNA m(7)G-527 methyltransferase [Pelagirhabdus alkalitolerans]|uniref:Ribosomal RNA small subunit methyltransferase G n=1 Tax=Pelagirhabdus alkalitolerans TaxID=1612202 RepID=A0A1G6LBI6_9BACI|nr:16S rRNA (guanine(527)-N(7))-methyltransferase RsmG [Pelagirhabdus alkalitolerans]SDC40493.1 16S rRNA m(7)G-527 methyltransferase [Pelagirhabdus alkalitolerans]